MMPLLALRFAVAAVAAPFAVCVVAVVAVDVVWCSVVGTGGCSSR